MSGAHGKVVGVNGNLVTAETDRPVMQNEVAFVVSGPLRLKAELIRVRGRFVEMQVFEDTTGLKAGDDVEFTSDLLSAELGPGLLSRVFDGLQNPLPELAQQTGRFLQRGAYLPALPRDVLWGYTPKAKVGDQLLAGDTLGTVAEGIFEHRIMVPFGLQGALTLEWAAAAGDYAVDQPVARLRDEAGAVHEAAMLQRWPVKVPIRCCRERLRPQEPLVTKVRIVDTFFPVARGGAFCVPGPFGAGKTVLQQITSRNAEVDVVILAACGERAGEVVETLREFPELMDPRTGRSLMERTMIVCNTSSMPVAAREASVYLAVTVAEYYRQMGLHVLLLADSTSRWAQALREVSGRLEEIPGEEAFPAYLESVIAAFYERGGLLRLRDGSLGSVTIGGTVSPAGGNFEEPVTQATLKVVGAFHGLSRERSDARRYPAVHPLESWSKYPTLAVAEDVEYGRRLLRRSHEVAQMMKVVGEEGTSMADFADHLKGEFLDAAYLQQDAFHEVDAATGADRQRRVFGALVRLLRAEVGFADKDAARAHFQRLLQATLDWNRAPWGGAEFEAGERAVRELFAQAEAVRGEAASAAPAGGQA